MHVNAHLRMMGANGVPKGRVDAQTCDHGRRPCLAHSLTDRVAPMITAMMFPAAEIAIKAGRPRACLLPKTASKNKAAASSPDERILAAGTAAKYATLARVYSMNTMTKEMGATLFRD